jgi:hypothetical protein
MWFLLVIVLFQADPTAAPDSISRAFPTEQACADAADKSMALLKDNHAAYASVRMNCQQVSDPRTQKDAAK